MDTRVCQWIYIERNELKCIANILKPCSYKGDNTNCEIIHATPYDSSKEMVISEIYPAISGEGTSTGTVCIIVRTVGCNLRCKYCLVSSTKIAVEKGDKDIQNIEVGDKVYSYNTKISTIELTEVIHISNRFVPTSEVVYVQGCKKMDKLYITKDHPIYVDHEWIPAKKISTASLTSLTSLTKLIRSPRRSISPHITKTFVTTEPLTPRQAARLGSDPFNGGGNKEEVLVHNITTKQGNFFANRLLVHNCDTVYAYEGGTKKTTQEVVNEVLSYGIKTVLFTGGEPLLDPDTASNFLRAMLENGITTYVETNGAVDIKGVKLLAHIVMDVKTPSSGMQDSMYWRNLGVIGNNDEVKFVISNREDYDYSKKIIEDYKLFDRTQNIFFSPTWSEDMSLAKELSSWMLEDKSLAKLMIQQHKVLYGKSMRGV